MLKKIIVPIIISIIAIAAGIVLWQHGEKKEEGLKTTGLPMKVVRQYWPGNYWVEIAQKKGWFKDAGLIIENAGDANKDFLGTIEDASEGKLDVHQYVFFDLIKYIVKGKKLVGVVATDMSFGGDGIVAQRDIQDITALKGKRVGVEENSFLEFVLDEALAWKKLSSKDVLLIEAKAENKDLFVEKKVDALLTWHPLLGDLERTYGGHIIFDTSYIPGIVIDVMAFQESFVEQRPGDVQAYINVWHKTTQFIKENPKEAFGIIADIYNVTPGEVQAFTQLDKMLDLQGNLIAFSYGTGFESLHGVARKINNFMIKKGLTNEQLDSTEFLDARFLRHLRRRE